MNDLVMCHRRFLNQNIDILKNQILFILFIYALDYDELYNFFNKQCWYIYASFRQTFYVGLEKKTFSILLAAFPHYMTFLLRPII
jgi:hypothetical protein